MVEPVIDFTKHKDLIKSELEKESKRDKNWKWSVSSVSKFGFKIRWSYLKYMEEPDELQCFSVKAPFPKDDFLFNNLDCVDPNGVSITYYTFGPDRLDHYSTLEEAIAACIRAIVGFALSRY